ncbi:MAG: hypothetical protein M1821_001764 [Bathelium mastoideum]|nr:MAG: hypothetical protein M1821_001764 [Bathelium mastoideum]
MEKGEYRRALDIALKGINICEKALQNGVHPGYSSWFVRDMSSYLYNVQASAELEMISSDSSLALHIKIRDIREDNKRMGNATDEMWIAAANGNIAVSLMTENRATEALSILDDLLRRDDLASNRDYYYLNNTSLCLRLLERLDEAHQCCDKALAAARNLQGEENLSTAFNLYREALEILEASECHRGALCRTAFALSEVYDQLSDPSAVVQYQNIGLSYREQITNSLGSNLGMTSQDYERFVGIAHR